MDDARLRTALLVIDLQRGAFDGVRCAPIAQAETLIDRACALLQAARAGGHVVVFIQHCEDAADSPFQTGSVHWRLHDRLVPAAGDVVVHKRASSAFDDTDLDLQLRTAGAARLVLCGLQSEHCVSNTARAALARGWAVQVADDAHGTWPADGASAAAIRAGVTAALAAAGAHVLATDRLVAELKSA